MSKTIITRGDCVLCDCGFESFHAIVIDISDGDYLVKPINKKLGLSNEKCVWVYGMDITISNTPENFTANVPGKPTVIENTVNRPHEAEIKTGKEIDHN
jgi:hypothetical protein